MKSIIIIATISLLCSEVMATTISDSTSSKYLNSAEKMIQNDGRLNIGGYGEVHFNQPFTNNRKELGTLDVHRMVIFMGYNFSKKTQFVSEIEFEYAKELWVEQAFLQHRINRSVNLRAGLLLVPMGIINEYHEPTTFNGVERPVIDNRLWLSTWREVGFGIAGTVLPVNMKYQLYAVSGLNGFDTKGVFNGSAGLRDGRQKGSKAYLSSPAFTGKIEYYGIKNLNIGLSGYAGKSQSKLYGNLSEEDISQKSRADSSSVGLVMFGADARYNRAGFELRGQLSYTSISNTMKYNTFTQIPGKINDLGKTMAGYYIEAGYNIFKPFKNLEQELVPFIRYEFYNTHQSVDNLTTKNTGYKNTLITAGLTLRLINNAVIKSDLQFIRSGSDKEFNRIFNAGIGVMF